MFSRWRNLAAASAAIWFPFCFAQASPHRDDLPCASRLVGTCDRLDDLEETDWYNSDPEPWFQEFFNKSWDEPALADENTMKSDDAPRLNAELQVPAPRDDDSATDSSLQREESMSLATDDDVVTDSITEDATIVVDDQGRCNDSTCPCHDIVDLGSADGRSKLTESEDVNAANRFDSLNEEMTTVEPGGMDMDEAFPQWFDSSNIDESSPIMSEDTDETWLFNIVTDDSSPDVTEYPETVCPFERMNVDSGSTNTNEFNAPGDEPTGEPPLPQTPALMAPSLVEADEAMEEGSDPAEMCDEAYPSTDYTSESSDESLPKARLTGTIEPLFDEFEFENDRADSDPTYDMFHSDADRSECFPMDGGPEADIVD